jgi:capsular exopolysaccharide synthesis family protein
MPQKRRKKILKSRFEKRTPIFSFYQDESPESLEFQRLFSKLKNVFADSVVRNLTVTSSVMGEGKSTTSSLLAITISKYQPTRTILIDFDLRNPKLHLLFDLERDGGVGEILEGKRPAKACFKKTPIPNLKVLTSGSISIPYSEAFSPSRLRQFFDEIRFYFDTIIIDTPPVIPVTDSLILSAETEGVLFVIRAGKTPREVVKRACTMVQDAGVKIVGCVVNDVEEVLPYYYNYDYYGYEYQSGKGKTGK